MTKTKITIKTSDKVEVTEAQARAIEEGIKCYEDQGLLKRGDRLYRLFVFEHWRVKNGKTDPWEGVFEPLNSMSAYELNRALLKGYIIKEGSE
ncbi:hypothetical protein [Bacillus nakamurai]|uniref:hypothetical protein n=1 Tax=Bacillus nakamurai TaxID=1793963 RepID=UPI0020C2E2DD|nr:hypothetical protein [Bacillus nakamurai]MCP6683225.1 hypothetical protein [Bacillus nakamurai]